MSIKKTKRKKAGWKGFTKKGMKKKGGKLVNNCVPIKKKK